MRNFSDIWIEYTLALSDFLTSELNLIDYDIYRRDREEKGGGGIFIGVKKKFQSVGQRWRCAWKSMAPGKGCWSKSFSGQNGPVGEGEDGIEEQQDRVGVGIIIRGVQNAQKYLKNDITLLFLR